MKTAESVTPSHPDKLCDRISDAILDACLEQDPLSRVAIETMGGHGIITITGELTTNAYVNIHDVVRKIVGDKYGIQTNIVTQSPEIARGVDNGGAGDQGIMVGYACSDNEDMIPQELYLARKLAKNLYETYSFDGKTQVTIDDNNQVLTIVASFQNVSSVDLKTAIYRWIEENGIECKPDVVVHANPAGDWSQGGFEADTGLTGRKLAVDNYGPQIPIGGGCFSGKDATKVDRSAAYMARHTAVQILKAHKAIDVVVKLAYAIGIAKPVMATATIRAWEDELKKGIVTKEVKLLSNHYENQNHFTPENIIEFLELLHPQFEKTAEWGHFGNGFVWDK